MQELTDIKKGAEIEWPGILFMEKDLFAMIYDSDLLDDPIDEFIASNVGEYQECYLGYNPKENTFYMGFDTWHSNDVVEFSDTDLPNVLRFRLDGDNLVSASWRRVEGRMFYSDNGYDELHNHMPELIDIRLD